MFSLKTVNFLSCTLPFLIVMYFPLPSLTVTKRGGICISRKFNGILKACL